MEYSGFSSQYFNNKATTSHHYKAKQVIDGKTVSSASYDNVQNRNAFQWHVWGMLWTPTEVSFYYDGVKYFSSEQPGNAATEDIPMQLIFSSSPHTVNADPEQPDHPNPNNAAKPGQNLPSFEIDWVRVHRGGSVGNPVNGNIVTMRKGSSTNFGIDGNFNGANGQNVYLWSYNSNNVNQQWEEIDRGNGYYSYKKNNTNYCLDGGNGGANGQNVYLWSCSSNNQNQHWKKINTGNGRYRLEKRNAPGYSIDGNWGGANGQNVYLWASSNSNVNQQWIFNGGSAASSADINATLTKEGDSLPFVVYPNPSRGETHFNLQLKEAGPVSIVIYDTSGRVVATIVNTNLKEGQHSFSWNPEQFNSGLFLVKLSTPSKIETFKLIIQ